MVYHMRNHMDHVWIMFERYVDDVWTMSGTCLGHVRAMFEAWLAHVWDMFGDV